ASLWAPCCWGRRPGLAGAGILLAGADLLPVGRDFRQQVNQVPPLGGVERRQEGVGCARERGGRLTLRTPAAGGQVDEERAAVLRAAHPFGQRLCFELVDQVNHRGAVDRPDGGQLDLGQ